MTVLRYFLELDKGEVRVYHRPVEEDQPNGHILFIGSEEEAYIFKGLLVIDGAKIFDFRRFDSLTEMVDDITKSFLLIHPKIKLSYSSSIFYASPHYMKDYVLT